MGQRLYILAYSFLRQSVVYLESRESSRQLIIHMIYFSCNAPPNGNVVLSLEVLMKVVMEHSFLIQII